MYCFPEHIERVKANYELLVGGVSCFPEIVGIMYEKSTLTEKAREQILKFVQSYQFRSAGEKLIEILISGSIDVYNCFLQALDQTRQMDVYNMLASRDKSMVDLKQKSGCKI